MAKRHIRVDQVQNYIGIFECLCGGRYLTYGEWVEHRDQERQQHNDAAVEDAQERAWEDNEARRIGLI